MKGVGELFKSKLGQITDVKHVTRERKESVNT